MEKHYLGLDVGGTKFAAGVVNERGRLIAKYQMPIGSKKGVEELTEAMYQVSSNALKIAGLAWDDVPYWGIGMPSTVNAATGLLVHAPSLRVFTVLFPASAPSATSVTAYFRPSAPVM